MTSTKATVSVGAIYVLALISVFLQASVILGDPAPPPSYNNGQFQEHFYQGMVLVLSLAIALLLFLLVRNKSTIAAWTAVPGVLLGLCLPVMFLAFRVQDFINAFH